MTFNVGKPLRPLVYQNKEDVEEDVDAATMCQLEKTKR